jgi:hypothetical protein
LFSVDLVTDRAAVYPGAGLKPPQFVAVSNIEAEEKTIRLANKDHFARSREYSIAVRESPFHLSLPDDLVSSGVECDEPPAALFTQGAEEYSIV